MNLHPLDISLKLAIEGDTNLSEKILRDYLKTNNDPRALFNLGWHEMRHGNLYEGMDLLTIGRHINVFGNLPLKTISPIWRGPEPKIILRSEGGMGDQIVNARFATNISKYGKVILLAHESLVPLLKNIEGVWDCLPDNIEVLPPHDYWVPAMSAAYVLKLEYKDLIGKPYLKVNPRKLEGDFKVGLRWAGNPEFEHQQYRKFDPNLMINLSNIPGATYYSLQRDNDLIDVPFTDLRDEMKTWEDTASILAGLDLVITSDTSIGHCAAALGVPTWIVVPVLPYYMWALPGNKTPWYDSVTLYRQEKFGNWDAPFEKIREDLTKLLSNK